MDRDHSGRESALGPRLTEEEALGALRAASRRVRRMVAWVLVVGAVAGAAMQVALSPQRDLSWGAIAGGAAVWIVLWGVSMWFLCLRPMIRNLDTFEEIDALEPAEVTDLRDRTKVTALADGTPMTWTVRRRQRARFEVGPRVWLTPRLANGKIVLVTADRSGASHVIQPSGTAAGESRWA